MHIKTCLLHFATAMLAAATVCSSPQDHVEVRVDAGRELGPLNPFWKATGFMPAAELETPAMRESLARVAALVPRPIDTLRPHYLLDLIAWKDDAPEWSRFDAAFDFLVREHGYKLVFEVMGNPSGHFDFKSDEGLKAWSGFVTDVVNRLIERYGRDTVRSWWFECWNEPDFEYFWKLGDEVFLRWYDATAVGVKAADSALRFGGPANALGLNDFYRKFTAHVAAKGNADFISVHRKALPADMIAQERGLIAHLREHHPALVGKPFLNTEADAEFGWSKSWWWRAHPWYAAFVAQSIDMHLRELRDKDGVDYAMGINDHGFRGGWGMRTLYASLPAPDGSTALIKKPVLAGMELLAHLGDTRLVSEISTSDAEGIGVMATRDRGGNLAVLLYFRPDIGDPMKASYPKVPQMKEQARTVTLRIPSGGMGTALLREWSLDETHGNPFALWQSLGSPTHPTQEQIRALREAEGPVEQPETLIQADSSGVHVIRFTLRPASLKLFILSAKP